MSEMKKRILELLKESSEPLSGQVISEKLNISRVGVWKHIQGLMKSGYSIQAASSGYTLVTGEDHLLPWEFPGREERIHYLEQTDSTMSVARELARMDCPAGTVVVAEKQSGGRGRMKRTWNSETGGLYFTVILRPDIPVHLCYLYNFAAAITLVDTFRGLYGLEASIKWPNDVLIAEKKVSGILLELNGEAGALSYLNLGIGININNNPGDELPFATSLSACVGRKLSRREVLTRFLDSFEHYSGVIDPGQVIRAFRSYCSTPGRQVNIALRDNAILTGRALGITEDGELEIETAEGEIRRIHYGDCSYI